MPATDAGGAGIAGLGRTGGVHAGRQPDTERGRGQKLCPSDGVDHEAASPVLSGRAEEGGEPGEEPLNVTRSGAGAFHRREPRADEAAEIPPQGQAEDRLLGAERAVEAGAV